MTMRLARPEDVTEAATPLLTAGVTRDELQAWFPVEFRRVDDPWQAAEPSEVALVRLDSGLCLVLWWGELSQQLKVEVPVSEDADAATEAFFRETAVPRSRVLWMTAAPRRLSMIREEPELS